MRFLHISRSAYSAGVFLSEGGGKTYPGPRVLVTELSLAVQVLVSLRQRAELSTLLDNIAHFVPHYLKFQYPSFSVLVPFLMPFTEKKGAVSLSFVSF